MQFVRIGKGCLRKGAGSTSPDYSGDSTLTEGEGKKVLKEE